MSNLKGNDIALKDILTNARVIAVVGHSDNLVMDVCIKVEYRRLEVLSERS